MVQLLTLVFAFMGGMQVPAPPVAGGPLALARDAGGLDLVARYEELSGLELSIDDEARAILEAVRLGATGPLAADADTALPVLETLFDALRFVLIDRGAEHSPRYALRSAGSVLRDAATPALRLAPDELARFAAHAALRVEVELSFAHLDVFATYNTLRPLIVDPARLAAFPNLETGALVVRGAAARVVRLAELLAEVDHATGGGALGQRIAAPPELRSEAGMRFPAGSTVDLWTLTHEYARATGQVLIANDEVVRLLEAGSPGLMGELEIEADELPRFFEELLRSRRVVLTELHARSPRIMLVESMDTTARGTIVTGARLVDATQLEVCASRAATVFATLLRVEGLDVRRFTNLARGMFSAVEASALLPLGGESTVLAIGFGDQLQRWNQLFAAASGGAIVASPPWPQARAELRLAPDDEGRIATARLLASVAELTGVTFASSSQTRNAIESGGLHVSEPITAARDQVWPIFEALLGELGFALAERSARAPRVVDILGEEDVRRAGLLPRALVPAGALSTQRAHPSRSIECMLPVIGVEPSALLNALRAWLPPGAGLEGAAVGTCLWLRGTGRGVSEFAAACAAIGGSSLGTGYACWPVAASGPLPALAGERVWRTLDELLFEYGRVTDQRVVLTEEVARNLWGERVELEPLRSLPAAEQPRALEQLLIERGFVRVELSGADARLIAIRPLPGPRRAAQPGEARFVPVTELAACAAHPATFYTTAFTLAHADPRALLGSLRSRGTLSQVSALADPPTLIFSGTGPTLAALVEELRALDVPLDDAR